MSVVLSVGGLRAVPLQGFPGDWSSKSINDAENSATWAGGVLTDVWTTTVGGFTNSHDYILAVTVLGQPLRNVSYTSDSSSSIDEVVQGLTDAYNADPILSAYGLASADLSANTVTIIGFSDSVTLTVADSDSDLTTVHTQSASTGTALSVARFAIKDTSKLTNPTPQGLPVSSLTAKVASGTIAYTSGAVYNWSITCGGGTYSGEVVADTNTATTLTAFLASINGAMPANTVAATSGGAGAYTLTAEVAGQSYGAIVYSRGGTLTFTDTNVLTDDISKVGLGVSLRRSDLAGNDLANGANDVTYVPGQAVALARYGRVWVDANGTPASNGAVYVDVSTGKLGASSGSGKCYLPSASWSGRVNDDASAYEVVLSLPQAA